MDILIEGLYCTGNDVYICKVSNLRDDTMPEHKESMLSLFTVSFDTEIDSDKEILKEVLKEAKKADMPSHIVLHQWPKVIALV